MSSNPHTPEKWPTYERTSHDYAHALGVVSVEYNHLEWILLLLFCAYLGAKREITTLLFEKSSTDFRLNILSHIANADPRCKDIQAQLHAFISGYEVCAYNRHILMHSHLTEQSDPDITRAIKQTKSGNRSFFALSIERVRQVADDINEWSSFGTSILLYPLRHKFEELSEMTLPEIPALPKKLEATTPPNCPVGDSQPQSSRA